MISALLAAVLSQAIATPTADQIKNIAGHHEQIILASSQNNGSVILFEKVNGHFKIKWGPVPAVFGKNGIADLDKKIEGDGKTPMGLFAIEGAFGYASSVTTKLKYNAVDAQDKWIDDVDSATYNTWVRGETSAKSFEKLRRDDDLYEYVLVTGYNRKPIVKGKGSAIFVHVWRGPTSTTAGCVAIAKENMIYLLSQLNANKKPALLVSVDF